VTGFVERDDRVVIRVIGLVNGTPTAFDGQYLVEYDPDRPGLEPITGRPMQCHMVTTKRLSDATVFTTESAYEVYKRVDQRNPIRSDGNPNRPLTGFTVAFEKLT